MTRRKPEKAMKRALTRSLVLLATLGLLAGGGNAHTAAPATDGAGPAAASAQPRAGAKLVRVDDLKDKRIGALQGSAHVEYVEKTWPQAKLLQYNSPADLLLAVKTG